MYSTKQLEKILLAELTRTQYNTFMEDVADSTDLSYKEIRNVRNSETFRKVFGNKQRIWIPLDIEVDDNINGKQHYEQLYKRYSNDTVVRNLAHDIFKLFDVWEMITKDNGKQEIDLNQLKQSDLLLYWIKGYVKVNGRIFKFGTLINRLVGIAKKVYANYPWDLSMVTNTLNKILEIFQNRKNQIDKLPKDLISEANNLTDEEIYGTSIKKDKLYICISRYPADVAAMSTGQGWSSCQNLDHNETKTNIDYTSLNWHVKYDISMGTCVAYLIKESAIKRSMQRQNKPTKYDDKFKGKTFIPKTSLFPLLSPTARIAIKPFYGYNTSNEGQVYLSIGFLDDMQNGRDTVIYGDTKYAEIFFDTVNAYLEERQSDINGNFAIPDELYNESLGHHNVVEVRNGKVIDTFGDNMTMDEEPFILTERVQNRIINKFNKFITDENGLRRFGVVLGGDDITGEYQYKQTNELVFNNVNLVNCHIKADIRKDEEIYFSLSQTMTSWIYNLFVYRELNMNGDWELDNYLRKVLFPKVKEFIQQNVYVNKDNPILVENSTIENVDRIEVSKQVTLTGNTFKDIRNVIFASYNCKQITNNYFDVRRIGIWLNKLTDKNFTTNNIYSYCTIVFHIPVVTELKRADLIYFVGDTFEDDCKMSGNTTDLEKIRFIDCTFNGEKIDGEAKIAGIEVKNGDTIRNIDVELNLENIEKI